MGWHPRGFGFRYGSVVHYISFDAPHFLWKASAHWFSFVFPLYSFVFCFVTSSFPLCIPLFPASVCPLILSFLTQNTHFETPATITTLGGYEPGQNGDCNHDSSGRHLSLCSHVQVEWLQIQLRVCRSHVQISTRRRNLRGFTQFFQTTFGAVPFNTFNTVILWTGS